MSYGIKIPLTKENLLSKIDSFNIFKKYCPEFEELGKGFKSPLRDTDKDPSAFIVYWEGDLLFKDFGKGSYRAISFVMERFGLTFMQAMQKINADFDLGLQSGAILVPDKAYRVEVPKEILEEKELCHIAIKRRLFGPSDIDYWFGRYSIKASTLKAFDVHAISHFEINGKLYFAHKYAYSYDYYWENNLFRRKIYQPFSPSKWFSNGGAIVQGEGMLPKEGDLLIITSSLKDVMTLYELGFTAVAPTSESTFVPESYFLKQNARFKRIIVFMDSDDAGLAANEKFSSKWGLKSIAIPKSFESKDISDFVWNHGQDEALRVVKSLI